ncbi:Jag N-terminal domain-containing protein [Synergistaceae bacterium OttesenSCG-928-D05]|nr:Jag N-terminal domain-containing protein [Synergistaceae bacterium OttesenSCG-928-D05]
MMERMEQAPMPEVETIILEAKSLDEARQKAANLWGINIEDIDVEVLEEDKKLFGLLGSSYRVEVRPCAPVSYIKSCYFVNEVMEQMELDLIPELTEDGIINLVGEDTGVVIGRFGETLRALEYLTNLACHEDMSTRRVRFDCGGYRKHREKTLSRLAESIAREVAHKGEAVSLEPMSSWERRIVHLALKESRDVETRSIGEEPARRVLVAPKHGARNQRGGKFDRRPRRR